MAENKNGSIAPMKSPIITIGSKRLTALTPATVEYETKSARAVRAAEPIANPLPMAAVVLPTASRVSVISLTDSGSSLISALSDTGPYASTATVIPVVESMPTAERAIP